MQSYNSCIWYLMDERKCLNNKTGKRKSHSAEKYKYLPIAIPSIWSDVLSFLLSQYVETIIRINESFQYYRNEHVLKEIYFVGTTEAVRIVFKETLPNNFSLPNLKPEIEPSLWKKKSWKQQHSGSGTNYRVWSPRW